MGKYIIENKWILFFALVFSIFVITFSPIEPLLYDNALYADIAKNIIQNQCFCSNFKPVPLTPPVFPILIAIFMLISGKFFITTTLVFISFFTIIVVYNFILKISKDKKIAILTTIFFFTTPLLIFNSLRLLTELLFTSLLILSLWSYILLLENGEKKMLLICSIFTALSIMTRFIGYLLIVIYLIYFFFQKRNVKINFKQLTLLIFLIFLFLFPWNFWRFPTPSNEMKVAGEILSGRGYGHFVFRMESFYFHGEPMNANPVNIDIDVPVHVVNIVRVLASLFILATPLLSLSVFYFLYNNKSFWKNRIDLLMILWILVFLLFHIFVFFYFGSRYLIPIILPIAFIFSRFIVSSYKKKKLLALVILLLHITSITLISYIDYQYRWDRINTTIFEESGIWIRENTNQDVKVTSLGFPNSALVYFSERKVVDINETIPDIIVESNFWFSSFSIENYKREFGIRLELIKEFSDERYFSKIYKRI